MQPQSQNQPTAPQPQQPTEQRTTQMGTNPSKQPLAPKNRTNQPPSKQTKSKGKKMESTQKSMLISEIRDGVVIMQDGSLRAAIMCESINFDLMSPQEREGVEFAYQNFLNSLGDPVQIMIRSQRINLDDYLEKLEKVKQNQDNILLGLLMEDYIAYVRYLIESSNIMAKQFYVIVPYYPSGFSIDNIAQSAQKFTELFKSSKKDVITINEADFNKYKQELSQSVRSVANGLLQVGINAVSLNTQELIELYYNVYNPVTAKQQELADVNQLDAPIVEKGEGEANQILNDGHM